MTANVGNPTRIYRTKLLPQVSVAFFVYNVIVLGRAIEDSGKSKSVGVLTYSLTYFVVYLKYLLLLIGFMFLLVWLSPVSLKADEFRAPNIWGISTTMKYSDIAGVSKKYFLGIGYYSFRSKRRAFFTPIVWAYLRNLDECLSEIEKRRNS